MKDEKKKSGTNNDKLKDLEKNRKDGKDEFLTTNQGVKINDNQNTLSAGERGPSLLEDFIFREKMTHFDHERIPERIVHPRGSGAHGYLEVYESMRDVTKAGFLQDPGKKTPVFARFSTVVGFRGSSDVVRDVRGFAVKFYTEEGNYDLVGNNMPVFFIQDAMKFPDLVHSIKPEQDNEMPQASAAHDTFWDFASLMPESMHTLLWVTSDRAIPRSLRMMEGFGVHTFRFINEEGKSTFVKFHWKPKLGVHGLLWDEAQKISGKNPDFHRQDLWEAIENGNYPEWELGVQLIPEEDEHKYEFDILDPTKLIPEELVPVQLIGKMVLNRNPDNFFAETEQVAFHPGHVVPGIDFSNDPLLQGRLFSYTDTQLIRLGGPNFHEIPINRPIAKSHNNQRGGHMRQEINVGKTNYHPNSLGGGCPFQAKMKEGGFVSHHEKIDANKIRTRSQSFLDFFSQATLFYNSQTEVEKKHIVDAFSFELGKVKMVEIRERMVGLLTQVDQDLAKQVAENLGVEYPREPEKPINKGIPADAGPEEFEPKHVEQTIKSSLPLSMLNNLVEFVASRTVAFLCADEVEDDSLNSMKKALEKEGATVKIVAPKTGMLKTSGGENVKIDDSFLTTTSVVFDAVYVPGGDQSISKLKNDGDAIHFLNEAYKHCKPIGAAENGALLESTYFYNRLPKDQFSKKGVILNGDKESLPKDFISAIKKHRFWNREKAENIPA
ncbi:catalase [Antarcticibacterium arcticum]|uniref:Catalase n=1 Tax=Antarcticibacterium arcticum TaxID=2585771 RepID=A0A5B8YIL1_9FLAO|nr:catalase [Antarcticibacterium arcticum]QED36888.1 catalase [Antarcticibacterium arcticum]